MRNNVFDKISATIMLLIAGLSFTSCNEFFEWLIDNPSEVTITQNEEGATVTLTTSGASMTVSSASDISNLLNKIVSDIASKGGSEYVVTISSSNLQTSGSDNTIIIPKVVGSNINLIFNVGINTSIPLTLKASETSSTTSTAAVNKLTVTMPSGTSGVTLNVEMPETSVTLKASSGSVVYNEIVAATAINTLYIEKGVTIKNLQVKGGRVVVKDGGAIETYVHSSDGYLMKISSDGVQPKYLPGITENGEEDWEHPVREITDENGSPYYCTNLKVIKGSEEVTFIEHEINPDKLFKKLIIGDGAAVNYKNGEDIRIETIEGEGQARFLYGVSYVDYDDNETMRYFGSINFKLVQNLSGVSFSPLWKDQVESETGIWGIPKNTKNCKFEARWIGGIGYGAKNCTFEAEQEIYSIYDGAEDCIYTAGRWITFNTPESSSVSYKNCKFNLTGDADYKYIFLNAPGQSSSIGSFIWNFTNCEFGSEVQIPASIQSTRLKLDENGEVVYMDVYNYWEKNSWTDEEGEHIYWYTNASTDFNDVPQEAKEYGEVDDNQFWNGDHNGYLIYKDQPQYETVEFDNYVARFAFDGCKTGNSALTSSNFPCHEIYRVPDGAKLYYTIEGTDYVPQWDDNYNFTLVQPNAATRGAYNRAGAQYKPSYIRPRYHQTPTRH